ncbi:MAG TPA: hypothetical protein EYP25_05040, partial [Anaerolineae bacterium]|nr:hypothetical protein [Anaerolineae bacterium]
MVFSDSPTLAVCGSIVMDIFVEAPRLPASGENLHARGIAPSTGGKGANAAVAFARLGGRSHLIANVGRDVFGREALETLAAEGVDVLYLDPPYVTEFGSNDY